MRRAGWSGSEVWLLALVLFGYGYFDNGHNWNHISRFDAIFSFVESAQFPVLLARGYTHVIMIGSGGPRLIALARTKGKR